MTRIRTIRSLVALQAAVVAATVTAAGVAHAQIGSGWTRYNLTQDYIDTQSMGRHMRHPVGVSFTTSGARYEASGTTETFELYDPSFNRVEHDTNYHYRTGSVQFEGTVEIFPGVNHQFIVQNFNAAGSGPIMALSAYSRNNGTIVKQGGSVEVATNIFGKRVKVNIIHDLDANTLAVYIDGRVAWQGGGGAGGGGFNFKYGSYGSLNESRSAKARWENVQIWTGGKATGGAGPNRDAAPAPDMAMPADARPPVDAVAPDRGGAPDLARDTAGGAGGNGGTGGGGGGGGAGAGGNGGAGGGGTGGGAAGAGGSGGAAGSPGTGGSPGAGGGPGTGGAAGSGGTGGDVGGGPPPAGGCGCDLGGTGQNHRGALLVGALIVAWDLRRRRSRARASTRRTG